VRSHQHGLGKKHQSSVVVYGPLHSNGRLLWLHNSCFQRICHNTFIYVQTYKSDGSNLLTIETSAVFGCVRERLLNTLLWKCLIITNTQALLKRIQNVFHFSLSRLFETVSDSAPFCKIHAETRLQAKCLLLLFNLNQNCNVSTNSGKTRQCRIS
jgi:hypothetical protein